MYSKEISDQKPGFDSKEEVLNPTEGYKINLDAARKTVRNMHTIIHLACEKAVVELILMLIPAIGWELPKKARKEMKILPLDQLLAFFAAAKEHGYYEIFYFDLQKACSGSNCSD